jgi:hypothetical protein
MIAVEKRSAPSYRRIGRAAFCEGHAATSEKGEDGVRLRERSVMVFYSNCSEIAFRRSRRVARSR